MTSPDGPPAADPAGDGLPPDHVAAEATTSEVPWSEPTQALNLDHTMPVDVLAAADPVPPPPEESTSGWTAMWPPSEPVQGVPAPPAPPAPPLSAPIPYAPAPTGQGFGDDPQPTPPAAPLTPLRRSGVWRRAAALVGIVVLSGAAGGIVGAKVVGGPATSRTGALVPSPVPGQSERPAGSIASIAAAALPSVVTIRVKDSQGEGTGSGFVMDDSGHILTNNHVVSSAGDGGTITIQFSDGTQHSATIVGRDVSYDLAVLKAAELSGQARPLQFGRSADVVVGDGVIAVGAPLGLEATVTTGIVSALGRPVTAGDGTEQSFISAIQTDAAINPGNSGGPLLDMAGRVIGINSAIARIPGSDTGTTGSIGLGFAIPSDKAYTTVQQLITKGTATHPIIGVRIDTSYDGEGVRVDSGTDGVTAGGPADKAGVRPSDLILKFEGRVVATPDELVVAIRAKEVGDQVSLEVRRDGQTRTVTMTLVGAGE